MSLSAIYNALRDSIDAGGDIDLYAAGAKPALDGLRTALALFGIDSAYVLRQARLGQTVSAVVLGGSGQFGVPGAQPSELQPVNAVLTATAPAGGDVFELALSIAAAGWTFSKTFPAEALPPYQRYDEETQSVALVPSFFIGLPLDSPVFSARSTPGAKLLLGGRLPAGGDLARYADLLPGWPLELSGSVVMPAERGAPPVFDLRALVPGVSIAFGATSLRDVGLRLVSYTGLDPQLNEVPALCVLELIGYVYFTADTPPLVLSTALSATVDTWRLRVAAPPGLITIGSSLAAVARLLGLPPADLMTPPDFGPLNDFYLSDIEVSLDAVASLAGAIPAVDYIAVTLRSDKVWNPPIPFVRVVDVGTRWIVGNLADSQEGSTYLSGCVYGGLLVGAQTPPAGGSVLQPAQPDLDRVVDDDNSFILDVNAQIPQYIVGGALRTGHSIPIGTAFRHFFGDPGPPTPSDMRVTAMSIEAEPLAKTVDVVAEITTDWTLPLTDKVVFHLVGLYFHVNVTQSAVYGQITGSIVLEGGQAPGDDPPRFEVGTEYSRSDDTSGWVFTGRLVPGAPLSLTALVVNLLGIDPPPSGLPELSVDRMSLRFETISKAYEAAGAVSARWNPTVFGTTLKLSVVAEADVVREKENAEPHGTLAGAFSVNRLELSIGRDIGVADPTYQFRLKFGELWLSAITSWTDKPTRHQLLTLQLGGVTLGGILEYLVNLAAPTIGFKLESPWDILNRVDLSRFALTVDPTYNEVALTYDVNLDIVVMKIRKIGVRYTKKNNQGAVNLILDGDFLGKKYEGDDALAWDVISDPPPAVPGQGTSLLDLRYLGAGQHVTLHDIRTLDTVRAVLDRLAEDMRPIEEPDKNPLSQPSGANMQFAADSEWLLGFDIGLMETVDLGFVFNDPRLYGLSIALGGERAGSLAGLNFEILYKKITNDIGLFRIELRLPEAFRHIELGEVSITLGVVVVEIYTNGNFLVDLGFPYQRNFERSFTVQVFPFIGRGGIYIGVLNGSTSRRVPAISNGDFSPVLELGVGLAVGVGKEISIGPLSGGIYVQVEVIFQGVLAWFNPTSSGTAPAKYYWCQGIAAIHGKLYGKVDFKIIKVTVSLEASAEASVILEAYRPTVFRLKVDVSVEAEVKVLFFTISFSFGIGLDVSFQVGSEQQTPWILAPGQNGAASARLLGNRMPRLSRDPALRRGLLRQQYLTTLRHAGLAAFADAANDALPYVLNWSKHAVVLSDAPRPLALSLLPNFSVDAIPLSWNGSPPPAGSPTYRTAMLLFADDGVEVQARSPAQARLRSAAHSAQAATADELPAAALVEAFLRWSIWAVTHPLAALGGTNEATTINAGQLALLIEQMSWPQTADAGFGYTNLSGFLAGNVKLKISGLPSGTTPPAERGGLAVPVPPALTLAWNGTSGEGTIDFADYNEVGPQYLHDINEYLAAFFPLATPPGPPPVTDEPRESFASYMFRDWCLMLAKAAVDAANGLLQDWPYTVGGDSESLDSIARSFPSASVPYRVRSGDSVDSVAAAVGATPEELVFLNPGIEARLASASAGSTIQLTLGIAPEIVALDNATATLSEGSHALGALDYQVRQTDTLNAIATTFALPGGAIDLFTGTKLDVDRALLRTGATFTAPASTYTPPAGFSTLRVAAVFYVRYYAPPLIPDADWYAATLFQWNAEALRNVDVDAPLPVGLGLKAPLRLYDTTQPAQPNYTTLPGDSLTRIGMALSLEQNYATSGDAPTPQWPAFRDAVSAQGGVVSLPSAPVTVLSGETVQRLADRMVLFGSSGSGQPVDIAGLLTWIGGAAILDPLALIHLPAVTANTATYPSFAAIANAYGISVSDVGRRLAAVQGIFPRSTKLVIAHLPVQTIDTLVAAVLNGPVLSDIYGQASRQLLAGLRLPAPVEVDGRIEARGAMTALYGLSGQEIETPPPDASASGTPVLNIAVSLDEGVDWIELVGATTTGPGETLDDLLARVPNALDHNARLATLQSRLPDGMIVLTDPQPALRYSYTASELALLYPPATLTLTPSDGPKALNLAAEVPRTYGLDHRIEVQSPLALAIPSPQGAPLIGTASVWPFSDALLAKAQAAAATPYEIVAAGARDSATSVPDTLLNTTFATLLPFQLRRLENRERVYDLRGVDTARRQLLLELWEYLSGGGAAPGTQAYLLVQPAPDAGNTSGLAVQALTPAATYLIKTNLSTDTVPGVQDSRLPAALARRDPSEPLYFADFGQLSDFLLLLWEGSVVGGSGYYLGVTTAAGEGLPASIFDGEGNATAYLLVIAGAQQAVAPEGRALLAFNNAALVGPGLDAAAQSLYVEATDGSDLVEVANVPPGHVGFSLTLPRPDASHPDGTPPPTAPLFSLLTFEVGPQPGAVFHADRPGLPVTPQGSDGTATPLWQRRRLARRRRAAGLAVEAAPPAGYWHYEQVLPIARMGPASVAPSAPGLPPAAEDPYRGIGGSGRLQQADVQLGFADLMGNVTAPPAQGDDAGIVPMDVGYTDVLVSLANWPASTSAFDVNRPTGTAQNVTLAVRIALQTGANQPDFGRSPAATLPAQAEQASKYREIYYQLAQPDLDVYLLTTLYQDAHGEPVAQTPADARRALWQFAAGAYAFSQSMAALQPVLAVQGSAANVGSLVARYGLGADLFAAANARLPAQALFGSAVPPVPAYAVFAERSSAKRIADAPQPGWPAPTAAAILGFDQNAKVLPLRIGAVLTTPKRAFDVPPGEPTLPLDDVAKTHATNAGLLASEPENSASTTLLRTGFVFQMEGLAVTVGDPIVPGEPALVNSFASVRQAFAAIGINAEIADIAAANGARTGMLVAGAAMASYHYIVAVSDPLQTLDSNHSGFDTARLIEKNIATEDLYDAGALIYLGLFSAVTMGEDGETLQGFAARYAATPALLFEQLAGDAAFELPANSALLVPGMLALPVAGDAVLAAPYTLIGGDRLDTIATRFDVPDDVDQAATLLVTRNVDMPNLLLPDQTISVELGGTDYSTSTAAGDTFASVLARLKQQSDQITLAALAASVATQAGLLAAGALMICPPAKFKGAAAAPNAIASRYGLDAAAFGQANLALAGLVAANVTLSSPADAAGKTVSVTTGAHDTLNTVLARFADKGRELGLSDVFAANADAALFAADALALLPPTAVAMSVAIGAGEGPYAQPIFPLDVGLRLQRRRDLVSPAFRSAGNDGPVERAQSGIPVPTSAQGQGSDPPQTLNRFADDFLRTFPKLRLATGKVAGYAADLWVVDFTAQGIADVTVAPGVLAPDGKAHWPRSFALRPLYADLVTRSDIRLDEVQPDGTLKLSDRGTDFQGVDVEVWARRFLSDVDRFLTAPYSTGIYADATARPALQKALAAKQRLVDGVAEGLAVILDVADAKAADGRRAAVTTLSQRLGINLATAYAAAAVVQYDASVRSAWNAGRSDLRPARLYGEPRAIDPATGSLLERHSGLTSAKTSLDATSSFVSFVLSVEDPAHQREAHLNLDYVYSYVEFDIEDIDVGPGPDYQASNWLSFLPPLSGKARPDDVHTRLGASDIPLPLRSYPAMPTLDEQGAAAQPADPLTLADTPLWRYTLRYSHEHAAQDEVIVTASFNIAPPAATFALATRPDVAAALARYDHAAERLWQMLAYYADPAGGDATTAGNAAQSLSTLIDEVAGLWTRYWQPPAQAAQAQETAAAGVPARLDYAFSARLDYGDEGRTIVALTLTAAQDQPGPIGAWPDAVYRSPAGVEIPLGNGSGTGRVRRYAFPADQSVPTAAWAGIALSWGSLNVARVQNARAALAVVRNRHLNAQADTALDFVYRSATVDAPNVVTPLNTWAEPIDISALGGDVATALNAAFTTLFGGDRIGQPVTLGLFYGYELVSAATPADALVTYLPVGLYPNQPISATTAADVAAALQRWKDDNHPATTGGEWAFSLILFSQVDTRAQRSLLTLERLIYRL